MGLFSLKENADTDKIKIGVVGAGSWGTALADLLGSKGFKVDFWAYEKEVKEQILVQRENKVFLPGFSLSPNLFPSNDLFKVVSGKDLVLIVVPSHVMRETTRQLTDHVSKDTIIVSASKGIENQSHLTMSGVLKETLPQISDSHFAVLSGPSFAKEVVKKVPTVVTVASNQSETAGFVQHVFATPFFRVYTSDDMIGVELGGSVKNVIAIAAGIVDGLGLGLNTRAALITRGLTEIRRLGLEMGANPRTFTGLAGVGDLILTCTGGLSRNHTVGKKIGEGMKLKEILSEMNMVAEGYYATKSAHELNKKNKKKTRLPIVNAVYEILYENKNPKKVFKKLVEQLD